MFYQLKFLGKEYLSSYSFLWGISCFIKESALFGFLSSIRQVHLFLWPLAKDNFVFKELQIRYLLDKTLIGRSILNSKTIFNKRVQIRNQNISRIINFSTKTILKYLEPIPINSHIINFIPELTGHPKPSLFTIYTQTQSTTESIVSIA